MSTSTTMEKRKMYKLISNDEVQFEICESAALRAETLRGCILHNKYPDNGFPFYFADAKVVEKIVEYLHKQPCCCIKSKKANDNSGVTVGSGKDEAFQLDDVDQDTLCEIILTARSLGVSDLAELAFAKLWSAY